MSIGTILIILLVMFCLGLVILATAIGLFFFMRSRASSKGKQKADHFAFQVEDLSRSIHFYTGKLGMKKMFSKIDDDHHEAFAFIELEGGNLELLQILDEENRPIPMEKREIAPPYCPHLAIQTEDLSELVQSLKEKDIPIIKGPLEIPGQVRWLYIADPDNNVIEYVQWLRSA